MTPLPLARATRGRARSRIPFALALVLASGMACRRESLVFPKAPVVLIVVDTLRADHLPAYGYRGVETPALDALARDAIVFDNAITQVPLTLPAHATLFTGLLPYENGVRDNVGYRLEKEHETLAGFLGARGWSTGGAISAVVLERGTGVAAGFHWYEDAVESREAGEAIGRVQRPGGRTRALLEEWIGKQAGDRPFFAFLHLYEPHTPYEPPEPFRTRYGARLYDGEVAASDAIVGDFVRFLKTKGIYERALVIVLSDHGEGLGQHGEDEHGIFLYRETTRVPLFLKLPGSRLGGRRVAAPAAIADVFPTIAAVIGEKLPRTMPGVSLLALAPEDSTRRVYSETLYPRFHFGWSDLASLMDDRWQYIHAPRPELYDWRADPQEETNLADGVPPAFRSMRVELTAMNRPLQAPGASDPETIKKLASLGYIGTASPSADDRNLPDPKEKIGTLDLLKKGGGLLERHREEEAIELLTAVVKENPLMVDGWETLARAYRRSGRPKEAREALREADRLTPGTAPILLGLCELSLELKDFAGARLYAEAARAVGASGVHGELAAIAVGEGDLVAARREALAAGRERPVSRGPHLLLARIEQRSGNFVGALEHLEEALRIDAGPLEGLQATRGDVLAHLGREREAEAAFRAEIEAFPRNFDAWQRLALLFASGGRAGELKSLLVEMTNRVPTARSFEAAARVSEIVGDRRGAREWRRRRSPSFEKPS